MHNTLITEHVIPRFLSDPVSLSVSPLLSIAITLSPLPRIARDRTHRSATLHRFPLTPPPRYRETANCPLCLSIGYDLSRRCRCRDSSVSKSSTILPRAPSRRFFSSDSPFRSIDARLIKREISISNRTCSRIFLGRARSIAVTARLSHLESLLFSQPSAKYVARYLTAAAYGVSESFAQRVTT